MTAVGRGRVNGTDMTVADGGRGNRWDLHQL